MIIASDDLVHVGRRYVANSLTDRNMETHYNVPMVVLRAATREEYVAYVAEMGLETKSLVHHPYYYEVSVD